MGAFNQATSTWKKTAKEVYFEVLRYGLLSKLFQMGIRKDFVLKNLQIEEAFSIHHNMANRVDLDS